MPPETTVTKIPRRRRLKIIGLVVIGLLALYALAVWQQARAYSNRHAAAKSAEVKGNFKFTGHDFAAIYNSDLRYQGGYASEGATLKFDGLLGSKNYTGQAVTKSGDLYLQLTGADLPGLRYKQSAFVYKLTPDWHKTKLGIGLLDNYCETRPDSRKPQPLLLYRLSKEVKPRKSPFVNFLSSADGHRATHFRGSIDAKKLAKVLDDINHEFPEGCPVPFVKPDDLKKAAVTWDLWSSSGIDRLRLRLTDKQLGASLEFVMDTTNFNQPVKVVPPDKFVDLDALRQGQYDVLSRDAVRKKGIDNLKVALDDYYRQNAQTYPAGLGQLAPKYIGSLPLDPKTKKSYNYQPSPDHKSFELTTDLEAPDAGGYGVTGPA